jgi:hypothetical protein
MVLSRTTRLAAKFPDAYAVDDAGSLLFRLLDVIGAELSRADDDVRRMLKSHWVGYAEGPALDALAALFDVSRRRLDDGTPEPDVSFRARLRAVVPLFTGGGTVTAVRGAVRSALGLPFDLSAFPPALRTDLESLITIAENVEAVDRVVGDSTFSGDGTELRMTVRPESVVDAYPSLTILGRVATGWSLRLERVGAPAIQTTEDFFLPADMPLTLTDAGGGVLRAQLGQDLVTSSFVSADTPVRLPIVPGGRPSEWVFSIRGASFDLAVFDDHSFGPPDLHVELSIRRARPLTFEVHIPSDFPAAVEAVRTRHNYAGPLFLFEGLPREAIQQVVDDTRAAGVLGTVVWD